jgi:hypothetical protein
MLLKPVQDAVQAQLSDQVQYLQQAGNDVKRQVAEYARTAYATVVEKLDWNALTQPLETAMTAASHAATIDSAIARGAELESLKQQLIQQIDQQATELLNPVGTGGSDDPPPQIKPIVAIRPATITYKTVLETKRDVDEYLEKLRTQLMAELEQGKRVRLE